MTWYTVSCGKTSIGLLLYKLYFMVKSIQCVMMGLGSNDCFLTGIPCLNESHSYGFASRLGHLKSDLVGLLVYDGMSTYPGLQCCITSPSRQCKPCWEGVNILGRPYEIELWDGTLDISIYTLYLFYIHYHLVQWKIILLHVISTSIEFTKW